MKIVTRHLLDGKLAREDVFKLNGNHTNCPDVIILEYEINPKELKNGPGLMVGTKQPQGLSTEVAMFDSPEFIRQYYKVLCCDHKWWQ